VTIEKLVIRGAREHNLKDVSLDLPRDALIVFTGLSGSGKSSLAFDTIFAEGQRRYVESLSAYARQFLGQMDKPDVDFIEAHGTGTVIGDPKECFAFGNVFAENRSSNKPLIITSLK
jgi:excinuclease UvrABC ATPase subunit